MPEDELFDGEVQGLPRKGLLPTGNSPFTASLIRITRP
jgi:hypothetical protein